MRPIVGVIAFALAALCVTSCGQRRPEPLSAFEGRVQDWTREILADSPETATKAGASIEIVGIPYADRLDDRSPLALEARRTDALRRLAELRAVDVEHLNAADNLTYRILREQFEAAAAGANYEYGDFTPLGGVRPYVLNQLDSAFLTLPAFFDRRQNIRTWADADAYLARLHEVPDALDAETQRAQHDAQNSAAPPIYVIDATLTLLDNLSGTPPQSQVYFLSLKRKLDALVAAETDPAARERLNTQELTLLAQANQIVRDEIIPANQRAAAALRAMRAGASQDPGVWRLPHGDAFYRDALRIATSTTLTPGQINRIGLDRVRELQAELDIALRRVGLTEGGVGQRLAQLTADPRYRYPDSDEGRAQLMADVRARIDRVMQRAPQWFGSLPRAHLDMRPVPQFAEASAPGGSYSAPSIDGSAPGVYSINLRNLAEMTKIDVPTQDFHEAVPGHHFQMALAQEQTQLPLLRRMISFDAYGEGWGVYAEDFAEEQGFYENDPIGRIGFLRWQLWRAARLVVDTGIHAGHWSRQQALDYLSQTTGDTAPTIATEVDRYMVWPGQACAYELGRREIMRLREHARTELGPDFDLRAFHDVVLLNGEVPLGVLSRLVDEWIPKQRDQAERARRRH